MKDTQRKSVLVATPRFIYVSFLFTLTSNIFPSKKCFMHFYDISSNVYCLFTRSSSYYINFFGRILCIILILVIKLMKQKLKCMYLRIIFYFIIVEYIFPPLDTCYFLLITFDLIIVQDRILIKLKDQILQ